MMTDFKQIFIVRTDLKMGKGKIAAQCSHAAVDAYEKALRENPKWVEEWKLQCVAKVVLKVSSEKALLEYYTALKLKFPTALIRDAGRTQIKANTATCLACGPAPAKELDYVTGELKLL